MSISSHKKWAISILSAVIFFIIACPGTFKITDNLLGGIGINTTDDDDEPTTTGVLVHAVVFMLITRGLMNYNTEDYLLSLMSSGPKKI